MKWSHHHTSSYTLVSWSTISGSLQTWRQRLFDIWVDDFLRSQSQTCLWSWYSRITEPDEFHLMRSHVLTLLIRRQFFSSIPKSNFVRFMENYLNQSLFILNHISIYYEPYYFRNFRSLQTAYEQLKQSSPSRNNKSIDEITNSLKTKL